MAGTEPLDAPTLHLVTLAAAIAAGVESSIREAAAACRQGAVPGEWVEELLLQSLLMVGYPRTLVATRIWRKVAGCPAPREDAGADYARVPEWTARGEATCRVVYGTNYPRLRAHVRDLHPALDAWMITEGYGRTLSRPGLDLIRRELCIVAQTAVLGVPRQLYSHLRGALNAGASVAQVDGVLAGLCPMLPGEWGKTVSELWVGVRGRRS